jgi:nitrogen regulatory protein PII
MLGQPPRGNNPDYYHHSLKLGESYYLGVGDIGFAIGYRYWKFSVYQTKNTSSPDFVEMMNVYFIQNSVTQSVVGVTATGGLSGFEAQNLLEENTDVWRDAFDGMNPTYIYFDFGKQVTLDEIKWRTSSNVDVGRDPTMVNIEGSNDGTQYNPHRFNMYSDVTDDRAAIIGDLFLDESVFFNTIAPPSNGYTIYEAKERQGPSIVTVANDTELLTWMQANLAPSISDIESGLDSIINSNQAWLRPIACVNLVHEKISVRECKLALDSKFVMSYPGTGTTWYNLVDVRDESFNLINGSLKPNGSLVYPTLESSPGGDSMRFSGDGQSMTFDLTPVDSVTTEIWCKFGDDFRDGVLFGFLNYAVICQDGKLGFTTTNLDSPGFYDLYGFDVSGKGMTGSYIHLVFTMQSEVDSYTNNKIYLNGEDQSLSQIVGEEFEDNRTFSSGRGKLAYVTDTDTPFLSLDFSCHVFRMYNTIFTQNEISLNYAAFQSRF